MKLIIRPEAEDELLEAIDWYEACNPGLGKICSVAWIPVSSVFSFTLNAIQ
ncbi:MAG: hypothetical protein L3J39_13885 [Verrucomicrobiales bacterium]|nr:hypothetical protein [Verrucomicrobiales bacterium]